MAKRTRLGLLLPSVVSSDTPDTCSTADAGSLVASASLMKRREDACTENEAVNVQRHTFSPILKMKGDVSVRIKESQTAIYTTRKHLPPEVIEKMREAFNPAITELSTNPTPTLEDQRKNSL